MLDSVFFIMKTLSSQWWLLCLLFVSVLYFATTRNHDFWRKRGIDGPPPIPYFGNSFEFFLKPFAQIEMERYKKYGPIYGVFQKQLPVLTVGQPELLKLIMVKDWHVFINRREGASVDEVFAKNLLNLRDEKWKQVRALLSPAFTSGKIRNMTPTINECVQGVLQNLEESARTESDVDLKRLFGAYTMDVIASCAFATKTDAHRNPDDPFLKHAFDFFRPKLARIIIVVTTPLWLRKILGLDFSAPSTNDFFKSFSRYAIQERKKSGIVRNDFVQLLVDAENLSDISEDVKDINGALFSSENADEITRNAKMLTKSNKGRQKLTDDEAAAQAFLFLIAGYETTGSLLMYCGYLLAIHPEVQDRLFDEIREAVKNDDDLSYEEINHLEYLNAVISESLRLYSPLTRMDREASSDYKLGETGIVIPKGTIVTLPFHALHHDPKYFPEPDSFKPERFLKENLSKIVPYSFMPFGAGPRNCIGMRFALWEAKIALCKALLRFEFVESKNTAIPLKFTTGSFLLQAESVVVSVRKRSS